MFPNPFFISILYLVVVIRRVFNICAPLKRVQIEDFINNQRLSKPMDTKPLEEIGLTKSEIKVYLALLKLGQTTAGPIVDEAKVTRSKIYDILERLKNKGLVSHIIKESTKYFSATSPTNIIEYLNKKN